MNRVILMFAMVLMLGFAGCAPGPKQAASELSKQETTMDRVQRTGVLRVGYFLMEPMIMRDKEDRPYGLFVDIVEQLARDMRWKIEYKQVDLKNFGAALQTGEFDLSIGPTFSSPSRASGVTFTHPIMYLGYTGVTTADKAEKFKTWSDVDQPGVRVAVKQGSAIGDYVTRVFKKAQVVSLEQPALSAPLAAVPGQADVGLMNQVTVFTFLRDNPQANLKEILADAPVEFTGVCWATRPDDPRWLEFINTVLKHYEDTGRVVEWEKKYRIPFMYHERRMFQFDTGDEKKILER